MNLDAEEKTRQVRLPDLKGTVVGDRSGHGDPSAANGHVDRFPDEFRRAEPAPDLTDLSGSMEERP